MQTPAKTALHRSASKRKVRAPDAIATADEARKKLSATLDPDGIFLP